MPSHILQNSEDVDRLSLLTDEDDEASDGELADDVLDRDERLVDDELEARLAASAAPVAAATLFCSRSSLTEKYLPENIKK